MTATRPVDPDYLKVIRRSTPLSGWLLPLTLPASWFFGLAVRCRNLAFEARLLKVRRVDIPVVCVGNLSAGGSGKTPFVRWLCRQLIERGFQPIIVMRGYKAQPGYKSDEQLEHEQSLPDVPVLTGANRRRSIEQWLSAKAPSHQEHGPLVAILDDGFQHRRLHRDFDIVLIDATRPPAADRLLPAGFLREPAASLRRADAVILNRCDLVRCTADLDALSVFVSRFSRHRHVGCARVAARWTGLASSAWPKEIQPVDWLQGRVITILCGIGNPGAFIDQSLRAGAIINRAVILPDHASLSLREIALVLNKSSASQAILTTEKDWARIQPLLLTRTPSSLPSIPLVRPQLEIQPISDMADLLDSITESIRHHPARIE